MRSFPSVPSYSTLSTILTASTNNLYNRSMSRDNLTLTNISSTSGISFHFQIPNPIDDLTEFSRSGYCSPYIPKVPSISEIMLIVKDDKCEDDHTSKFNAEENCNSNSPKDTKKDAPKRKKEEILDVETTNAQPTSILFEPSRKKVKTDEPSSQATVIVSTSNQSSINIDDSLSGDHYGDFNFIGQFGSFGSEESCFDGPVDIKYHNERDLLIIAEWNNNRVQFFDARTLEFKYKFSTISDIRGIALDPTNQNSLLVSCDNGVIYRYTIVENWQVEEYGSKGSGKNQLLGPTGIVVDPSDGKLYVCDCGNSRIQVLSSEGKFLYSFGTKGSGNGQFKGPWAIDFDLQGNLMITDSENHRIQVFDTSGNYLCDFGKRGTFAGDFINPRGILVDCISGNVIVCDEGNNRVQIFNSNHQHIRTIADTKSIMHGPTGLTLDHSRGRLYVTEWDHENNSILVFK